MAGHHHPEAAGFDIQKVEPLDRCTNHPTADLLDDSDAMIGINDLIADVEIQIGTAHILGTQTVEGYVGSSPSYCKNYCKYATPRLRVRQGM